MEERELPGVAAVVFAGAEAEAVAAGMAFVLAEAGLLVVVLEFELEYAEAALAVVDPLLDLCPTY